MTLKEEFLRALESVNSQAKHIVRVVEDDRFSNKARAAALDSEVRILRNRLDVLAELAVVIKHITRVESGL